MAIVNSATFGPATNIQESLAAGASASGAIAVNATLPATGAIARSLSIGTTGAPTSCNVKIDGLAVLGASGTVTIDLMAFVGPNGATKTMSKLRGYHFENEAAADAGINSVVTIIAPTVNGQTFGGKWTNAGYPLAANSPDCGGNLNSAGYTVNSTNKLVTFTAGSAGASLRFVFFGE